jgi:glycosyltransferase involved in cell wall biosynthesis
MQKRIAIDATLVGTRVTGAARFLLGLAPALAAADPGRDYVILARSEATAFASTGVTVRTVELGSGLRWELSGAARAAREVGAEVLLTVRELVGAQPPSTVMHVFEPPAYRLENRPPLSVHGVKAFAKDLLLAQLFQRSVGRAAAVTAGSEATATWLREHTGAAAAVVLPGLDSRFLEPSEPAGGRFFLLGASGDERENTSLVLAAFARAQLDPDVRLLVFGTPTASRARVLDAAADAGVADRVELLGWVTDDELRSLYAGAIALIHATRYEAYAGYPALEALAAGTPVVAIDAPGVTEAVDGVGLLAEAATPEALAVHITAIAASPELRGRLGDAGRIRAAALTWERAAKGFVGVFDALQ